MPIDLTTRCLRVESVIGDVVRQVNVMRDIELPEPARYIESIDTKIKHVEHKILPNKVIVEITVHRQVFYVECCSGAVKEFSLPDEKITEFVHIEGARPCEEQTAKVKVDIEYCDTDVIHEHKERDHHHHRDDFDRDRDKDRDRRDRDICHRKFHQTCIFKLRAKVVEMVEIPVITSLSGEGLVPVYSNISVDHVLAYGTEQFNLSDSFIELPANTKKVKFVDAEIRDVEKKVIPDKVIVKGKLHKQIFYVEDSGEVKEMQTDVPFSVFVPLEGACENSNVTTDVEIEYIDSELVKRGGNKFVKETVILRVTARLIERVCLNVLTGVEGGSVETNTVYIENMVGCNCRQVNLVESIITPHPARKVAWIETHLHDLMAEVIPNKVIVKGVLRKHIFYVSDDDDQLRALCVEEPFTEFIHIQGAEKDDTVDVWGRVEFVDLEPIDHKPTCRWRQTAIIELCAMVTETQELTVVTGVFPEEVTEEEPEVPEPEEEMEEETEECPPGTTFDYTVQPGDTMFKIAQKHNVTVNQVIQANPDIPNPNVLFVGQVIKVPCPNGMG